MHPGARALTRAIGLAVPVVWFGILFLAGAMRPGYDHVRQYMTELTVGGDRASLVAEADFFIVGPLIVLVAYLLWRDGLPRLAAALIVVKGIATIAQGVFIGDATIGVHTTSGLIHNALVLVGSVAMIAAMLIVARSSRRLRGVHIATATFVAVCTILLVVATPQGTGRPDAALASWAGLVQRLSMLGNNVWPTILAFTTRAR